MEILTTTVITTGISVPVAMLFAFVIGAFMFLLTSYLLEFFVCERATLLAAICGCVLAALCGIILLAFPEKEIVQYKVTIDETVSFVEFHKKYEIIDQEGEIYTIQEKENND